MTQNLDRIDYRKIIIGITCYNNENEVVEFCEQFNGISFGNSKIIICVTCNSICQIDYLIDGLESIQADIRLYYPERNLGYLNGCLYGVSKIDELNIDDWIIVTNTDVVFDMKFFDVIFKGSNRNINIWCFGPDIVLPNGRKQNPFLKERLSLKTIKKLSIIHSNRIFLSIYTYLSRIKKRKLKSKNVNSGAVYAVHGSCFAICYDLFRILQKKDNRIFMYGEELFIAELVRENDKIVWYENSVLIKHNENSTTGLLSNKMKSKWYKDSFAYLLKTFNF